MNTYSCFKGRGRIALALRSAFLAKTAGLIAVGNASMLDLNISEKSEDVPDYTTSAGGNDCNVRLIEKVEFDLSMSHWTPENIARATLGTGTADNVATAVVASEPHVAHPGAIVPLDNVPDLSVVIVVKSVDDLTTYTAGTDYTVTESGSIEILAGTTIPAPTITAGVGQPNIHVGYTSVTHSVIQLLTNKSQDYVLHFDGVNLVTGNPAQFDLFNVRLSPGKKLSALGDTVGRIDVTGSVQRDLSKPVGSVGNPLSQYGTIKLTA